MPIEETPRNWSEVMTGWQLDYPYVVLMFDWIYKGS